MSLLLRAHFIFVLISAKKCCNTFDLWELQGCSRTHILTVRKHGIRSLKHYTRKASICITNINLPIWSLILSKTYQKHLLTIKYSPKDLAKRNPKIASFAVNLKLLYVTSMESIFTVLYIFYNFNMIIPHSLYISLL